MTSETPTTKPAKNPKRVAAGKLVAEKTRKSREAQKKAAAEAAGIISAKAKKASASADTPPAAQQPTEAASGLSSTQWLVIGARGFVISLIGLYYKREEVKAAFASRPHAVTPESAEPSKNNKKGNRSMD